MSSPLVRIAAVANQVGADGLELRERPLNKGALVRLWLPDRPAVEKLREVVPSGWDYNAMEHLETVTSSGGPGWQVTIGVPQAALAEARDALPAAQQAIATGEDVPLVPEIVTPELVPTGPAETREIYDHTAWQRLDLFPAQILASAMNRLNCETLEARARFDTATRSTAGYRLVFSCPDDQAALVAAALVEALGGSLEPGRPTLALGVRLPDLPVVACWLPPHFGPFPA